ncbi:N-acetyltransferase [Nibribacter ruber]|uniref:N-acetyltransferase n=1 Tax=Nibribacter ruber TaxID=2698458 RepID=A0A6P1NWB0_9BACT|nr:GNAT family N-acetyltransferase [Nibribacter ruber]QHL85911.1 N-acetyltransferase [Nibribacter ruber]
MKLDIVHDQEDFRFYAPLGDEEAEMTYTYPEEKVLDLDYTFIPEAYRNQGLADQLVKAGLDFVQAQGYQFIPSCPVVEAYVQRHPEYQSLMKE